MKILTLIFLFSFLCAQDNTNQTSSLKKLAGQSLKFEHIDSRQGLSDNIVRSIIQDHKGYMWFGTRNGLNRYDGYTIKVYKNIFGDSSSLSYNNIKFLYEDRSGKLWVGTYGGLCRYDREYDCFVRYPVDSIVPTSLRHKVVVSIFETIDNNNTTLWVSTISALHRYNPDTDNFTRYYPEGDTLKYKTNNNWIESIVQDNSGRIWIGTWHEGLFYFEQETDRFVKYKTKPQYSKIFNNNSIVELHASQEKGRDVIWMASYTNGLYKVYLDNEYVKNCLPKSDTNGNLIKIKIISMHNPKDNMGQMLWIGTTDGLYLFDKRNDKFILLKDKSISSDNHNSILAYSIYQDKAGIIWVGTNYGIKMYNPQKSNFNMIKHLIGSKTTQTVPEVLSFCETESDNQKTLWLGTAKNGLLKYIQRTGHITSFKHDPNNQNTISNNTITSIIKSQKNNYNYLWVGTASGFNRINLNTEQIKRFYIKDVDYAVSNIISAICQDNKGLIWIGTQSSSLFSFDPINETFTRYPGTLPIYALALDSLNNLWVGRMAGLKKINTNTGEIITYKHNPENPNSISMADVNTIHIGKNGNIWIGTTNGLTRFDSNMKNFTHYTEKDGLLNDMVRAILEDDNGNLWISSRNGISKFNPSNITFKNFDAGDGLQDNSFKFRAAYKN